MDWACSMIIVEDKYIYDIRGKTTRKETVGNTKT
jgi:hypothetical protein